MNQCCGCFDANLAPLMAIAIATAMTACSLRQGLERSERSTVGVQQLAAGGDADAQFELGKAYFYGRGVQKDTKVAFGLFTTAANHGNMSAQTALAVMYIEGIGVPRDVDAGASWMRRAASEGYPSAIARLGSMYMHGIGVKQDLSEGIKLLEKAAARDDV